MQHSSSNCSQSQDRQDESCSHIGQVQRTERYGDWNPESKKLTGSGAFIEAQEVTIQRHVVQRHNKVSRDKQLAWDQRARHTVPAARPNFSPSFQRTVAWDAFTSRGHRYRHSLVRVEGLLQMVHQDVLARRGALGHAEGGDKVVVLDLCAVLCEVDPLPNLVLVHLRRTKNLHLISLPYKDCLSKGTAGGTRKAAFLVLSSASAAFETSSAF